MSAPLTRALVREPGPALVRGQRQVDRGAPDPARAAAQHGAYVAALRGAGLRVEVRPADPDFPDGCFVEDTHLVLPERVVRLRPGTPSRAAEPETLAAWLPDDRPCSPLPPGLSMDGGDLLRVGRRILAGSSTRTSPAAIEALAALLGRDGYTVVAVPVAAGLHLKSSLGALPEGGLVASAAFAAGPGAAGLGDLEVLPAGEALGANLVVANGVALVPPGLAGLRRILAARAPGTRVVEVDVGEFHKVDGMLTCLSLLW